MKQKSEAVDYATFCILKLYIMNEILETMQKLIVQEANTIALEIYVKSEKGNVLQMYKDRLKNCYEVKLLILNKLKEQSEKEINGLKEML